MRLGPGLRAALVRDLARSRTEQGGLKRYLSIANVVPIGVQDARGFAFEIGDVDVLQRYVAGDFERFALASLESFYRSRERGADFSFLGWRLLESYYAGFFAAHALMRALGGGVSQVGAPELQRLNQLADLYGISGLSLSAGSVMFETAEIGGTWQISARQSTRGNGVHDGFWRDFCSFLQRNAQTAVESGTPDAENYLAAAIQLSDAISPDGVGTSSWLASIRNAINYRQEFDVWFPYHKSVDVSFRSRKKIEGAEAGIRLDLSNSKESLQLFENVNSKIVYILWDVADFFLSISKKSGHFGNRYSRMISLKS